MDLGIIFHICLSESIWQITVKLKPPPINNKTRLIEAGKLWLAD